MATVKPKNQEDIRLELTITLSIKDWEKLLSQLEKKDKKVVGWFSCSIERLLFYIKNGNKLDQGEIDMESRYKIKDQIKEKDVGEIKIELTVSHFVDYWNGLLNNLISASPSGDLAYTIDQMLNDINDGVPI